MAVKSKSTGKSGEVKETSGRVFEEKVKTASD